MIIGAFELVDCQALSIASFLVFEEVLMNNSLHGEL